MSFWQYCDKLQNCIGFRNVIDNVNRIYLEFYMQNKTIGQAAEEFRSDKSVIRS